MKKTQTLIGRLAAIALLTVSSCSRNQPTAETSPSSPSPSATASPAVASTVNPALAALFTPEQQTKLLELDMKVVVPAYVPTGFQIDALTTSKGSPPDQQTRPDDVPFYQITYRGPNNTCLRVGSGNQGLRDTPTSQTVVNTQRFGQINVDYGTAKQSSESIEIIQAVIPGVEGYWLDSGKDPRQPCQPVALEEYTKVLQSLDYLQTETSTGKTTAATPLAAIDPNCRSHFRQVTTSDGSPLTVKANDGAEKTIANGTTVLFNVSAGRGDRSEITLPGGFQGWVDNKNLSETQVGGSQFTGKMQVKTLDGSEVNLRAEPSLEAKIVGALPDGTAVTVKGQKTGYWWAVVTDKGAEGYVAQQFLICQ